LTPVRTTNDSTSGPEGTIVGPSDASGYVIARATVTDAALAADLGVDPGDDEELPTI
jgi:hypothetical protein